MYMGRQGDLLSPQSGWIYSKPSSQNHACNPNVLVVEYCWRSVVLEKVVFPCPLVVALFLHGRWSRSDPWLVWPTAEQRSIAWWDVHKKYMQTKGDVIRVTHLYLSRFSSNGRLILSSGLRVSFGASIMYRSSAACFLIALLGCVCSTVLYTWIHSASLPHACPQEVNVVSCQHNTRILTLLPKQDAHATHAQQESDDKA